MIALDLFCGAGGSAVGLKRCGFFVVGVDIKVPTSYAGDVFIQADIHDLPFRDLLWADFVCASPPCQLFTTANNRWGTNVEHENLIPITREVLKGHPWTCIENVPNSPLREDLFLWGPQVGLGPTEEKDGLWRKRIFELSFFAWNPVKPKMHRGRYYTITNSLGARGHFYRRKDEGLPGTLTKEEAKECMGIPIELEMTKQEIANAVPPAYMEYIVSELLARMRESGYTPVQERSKNARYRFNLHQLSQLQEVPF